jgi:hypothetical protein
MTLFPGPPRLRARWFFALFMSVALHALGLFALTQLPGSARWPAPAPFAWGQADPPANEETGAITYLVSGPPPSQRAVTPAPVNAAPPKPPDIGPIAKVWPPAGLAAAGQKHLPGSFASAGQGIGLSGGAVGARFFRVPAQARSVIYVIDHSASMGLHGALDQAKAELLASLQELSPATRCQVIVYNSRAQLLRPDLPGLVAATPENKSLLVQALAELQAEGGTRHDQALPRALALLPEVIYFLTDADDLSDAEVRAVTQRNRGRSIIHVIELTTATHHRSDMPLQMLARDNGGIYQAVNLEN